MFRPVFVLVLFLLTAGSAVPAEASPTMVRLGYAKCTACHLAPQGGGLLTDYGKGIDDAQSLLKREYQPPASATSRKLRYDGRLLTSGSSTTTDSSGTAPTAPPWLRSYFRSSAAIGARNRLASTFYFEAPSGGVARLWDSKPTIDVLATWEYQRSEHFTFALTRDRLPRGVELGETRTILQGGEADPFPTQLRAFVGSERFLITTYAYGPGSEAAMDRRSFGGGVLGEIQLVSNHLVLGISSRQAFDDIADSQSVGAFVRMGFGKWGVLAEHEFTNRTNASLPQFAGDRYAGYTQLFVAPVEWLVTSVIGEHSHDLDGLDARVLRWRPEVQARLSSYITVTASARSDARRGFPGTSRLYLVQVAVKSVQ